MHKNKRSKVVPNLTEVYSIVETKILSSFNRRQRKQNKEELYEN